MHIMYLVNIFPHSLYFILLELSRLFKVNIVIGSVSTHLSGINISGPLAGMGGLGGIMLLAGWTFAHMCIKNSFISLTAYHIPTFCASAYWATRSWFVRVGIPVACMALFAAHPVGREAFFYSFYWIIPLLVFYIPHDSLFLTALGSTFVAHAVGSVIWLYTGYYTPAMFWALMPVVLLERMIFALGMVGQIQLGRFLVAKLPSLQVFGVRRQEATTSH